MRSTQPAATARTPAPHVATAPQGRPGPPAPATQATQPITAAQRQRAYRQRSKRAVTQAIGDEARASRVTLLVLLGQDLALLDEETASSRHSAARSSARRVINALVTRYDVNLEGQDRT
jgi:hypothetical protein